VKGIKEMMMMMDEWDIGEDDDDDEGDGDDSDTYIYI
jgi:hypothetical protein